MNDDRYDRHRRLPEVGAEGQARIERTPAILRDPEGGLIALLYLERAGVPAAELRPARGEDAFVHGSRFHFQASREIAAGAWHALRHLRHTLRLGVH